MLAQIALSASVIAEVSIVTTEVQNFSVLEILKRFVNLPTCRVAIRFRSRLGN